MRIVSEVLGLAGAGAVVYGCYLVWHPLAFMVGGALGIIGAAAMARRAE